MQLHTALISYHRRELTQIAIDSYLATVTLPHTLVVIDNGSPYHEREWLLDYGQRHAFTTIFLPANRYPGFATNRAWEHAPPEATHLQRADNDFRFLPGWCDEVARMFTATPNLGQLGLRTDPEEDYAPFNVGGNCVINRHVWDAGTRWDERPWSEYPPGHTEDSVMTPAVVGLGWGWDRVERPCIENLARADIDDPYYREVFAVRRILHMLEP